MSRPDAVLLLGPPGAGKSPLGARLERDGLWGRRCLHFDFGARLRAADRGAGGPDGLGERERTVVRRALARGALLEDAHFPVARAMLRAFLEAPGGANGALLVLDGLPRHAGQARDMEAEVRLRAVIHLAATPEAARERIRADPDADRAGRGDDREALLRGRLRLYEERTAPLLAWYRERGVPVVTLPVGGATTARETARDLGSAPPPPGLEATPHSP